MRTEGSVVTFYRHEYHAIIGVCVCVCAVSAEGRGFVHWIEYGFPISCIRRLTSKEDYTMMLLCIVDIYFYHLWMNSLGWSFFGNFKSCLRGEESFEKNYSKQKPRWTCDISMAAFLMVKKKRKKKKESRIGQENWKRQMIRKIHLQFQISELSIYSRYRRISSNSWPRSEKHRFVSAYPVQELIVAVIGEAFPRPTFVSNFIATIATLRPCQRSFPFYF